MKEDISCYLDNYNEETKQRFNVLYELLMLSTTREVIEKLWAKLPSYYVGDRFVRLIPFKDHINIEAKAIPFYKDKLTEYKVTPKGMLQLYHNQQIPVELLKKIFVESLED